MTSIVSQRYLKSSLTVSASYLKLHDPTLTHQSLLTSFGSLNNHFSDSGFETTNFILGSDEKQQDESKHLVNGGI